MKRILLCLAAALALASCERAKQPADAGALASPRVSGHLYTCDVIYKAEHGPLTSESRAQVRMGVDTDGLDPGWKVESVTVVTPLADADGFDPWLPFMAGATRDFVAAPGPALTLATIEDAPLTFDALSGDLRWSHEGLLGATSYTGSCY